MDIPLKWLLIFALLTLAFFLASCNWFNQAPVAQISVSTTSGEAPLTVDFDGAGSYDPNGSISYYDWDFGDGNRAYGATASHTYQDDGSFTATLTVTDNNGATDYNSVTITVAKPSGYYTPIFTWYWDGDIPWNWQMTIPRSLYHDFLNKPRPECFPRSTESCDFVLNPEDDSLMNNLANQLNQETSIHFETLEFALFFVQGGIRYDYWESPQQPKGFDCPNCPDPPTESRNPNKNPNKGFEYPRYPVETLATGYGDCEDTAILYASLIRTFGSGAVLAYIDLPEPHGAHMVSLAPVSKSWYNQNKARLEYSCARKTLALNAFTKPGSTDKVWLWAETAHDPEPKNPYDYYPLGCYSMKVEVNWIKKSWDVSSEMWVELEALD